MLWDDILEMSISERLILKITRLGKYNRTTVPGEIRKLISLQEGDELAWILEKNRITIEKAKRGR